MAKLRVLGDRDKGVFRKTDLIPQPIFLFSSFLSTVQKIRSQLDLNLDRQSKKRGR